MNSLANIDITELAKAHWQAVFKTVNKAVVFLDDNFAECLHWMGGASTLISCGAIDIKHFSSFESAKEFERKAVFLVSAPIYGTVEQILIDILRSSHFEYAILISCLPPALHTLMRYGHVEDETKAFHHIEDIMLTHMGNKNFTADVQYLPVTCAPVTSHLFVLPGQHAMFPLLPHQWQKLLAESDLKLPNPSPVDLDGSQLPRELQRNIKLLVYELNSVLEQLEVSDDVHSLGHTSRLIANELANLTVAKHRRKTCQRKASIVVVDRTLDLVSVLGHHGDTLLDKLLAVNQPLPGHHNDIAVNMAPLCSLKSTCSDVILPGCLAHATQHDARELFSTIATAKQKEALLEVKLSLKEAANKEDLDVTTERDQSTVNHLHTYLNAFKGEGAKVRRQSGVLQLASATVQTLTNQSLDKYNSLLGIEKGFLQCVDEDGNAPLTQIIQLLDRYVHAEKDQRSHSLEEILGVLAYVYSLCSSEDMIDREQEEQLKPLLVRALMETSLNDLPPCIIHALQGRELGDVVTQIVSSITCTLRGLTSTRETLTKFRQVYSEGSDLSQASLTPILEQLTHEIFKPSKQEVPDLVYKSTGFRDLIKSGFGLFMSVSKPRPNDHPLLIVFIVGGVTSSELRLIENAAASDSQTQVLVGSTRLVTPKDIINQIYSIDIP